MPLSDFFSTAKIQRPDIIPSENVLRWSLQIWKVGQRSLTLLPNMVIPSKYADFYQALGHEGALALGHEGGLALGHEATTS